MLMGNETVTLIQMRQTDDGETYVCSVINDASWYGKAVTMLSTDGAKVQNTYKVRFADSSITPQPGDYIVRGIVSSVRRVPADIAEREYFRISAVGDNRRGRLQHWAVSGA